jgi:Fic family protein
MVHLERKKDKKNTYFRLVHTIRKGSKITHKTKYIGKDLPSKAGLEQLKKEFIKEINGQRYRYLSADDVEKIEQKKEDYTKEIKKLSFIEKEKHLEEFIIRFTYDSSKLSGVPVTLRQTSLILKEGIVPKNIKNLRTVKELENHEKGVLIITKYKGAFNIKFVQKLHKTLLAGVDDQIAGKLRSELQRNVKVTGTAYVPPKWKEIDKELDDFFKWYKTESRKLHPLELAALIHLKIISMQPFVDGNSRLSRLLMNWILWKKNYPPIDIPVEDLEDYYNALDKFQIEKNEKTFVNYIKKRYFKTK